MTVEDRTALRLRAARGRPEPAMSVKGSAELAAEALRDRIVTGRLRPGSHLSEDQVSRSFGISRNTLREAFRLLGLEGLVEHFPNRGVFVRVVGDADIDDLYLIRTALETSALQVAARRGAVDLGRLSATIGRAAAAAGRGEWEAVGREDIEFHRDLVSLAGSPRMDAAIERVLVELQLVFYAVEDEAALYGRYIDRNRAISELVEAGEWEAAAEELRRYLDDSRLDTKARSRAAAPDLP